MSKINNGSVLYMIQIDVLFFNDRNERTEKIYNIEFDPLKKDMFNIGVSGLENGKISTSYNNTLSDVKLFLQKHGVSKEDNITVVGIAVRKNIEDAFFEERIVESDLGIRGFNQDIFLVAFDEYDKIRLRKFVSNKFQDKKVQININSPFSETDNLSVAENIVYEIYKYCKELRKN